MGCTEKSPIFLLATLVLHKLEVVPLVGVIKTIQLRSILAIKKFLTPNNDNTACRQGRVGYIRLYLVQKTEKQKQRGTNRPPWQPKGVGEGGNVLPLAERSSIASYWGPLSHLRYTYFRHNAKKIIGCNKNLMLV